MSRPIWRIDLQHFAQEKTEKATPKKRQDSRKKGQVAKTPELPGALIMMFVFLFLFFMGDYMGKHLLSVYRHTYTEFLLWDLTVQSTEKIFNEVLLIAFKVAAPVFIIAIIIGVFSNYLQFGFLFTGEPLKMKLSKINPIEGAKRIFALRALVELVKSILKVTITTAASFLVLYGAREDLLVLARKNVWEVLHLVGSMAVQLGLIISVLLIFVAILDYVYQRYDHEKQIKMSKQDIKDEHKKTEGDPQVQSKRKEKQREVSMQRMMQEVPDADVVITNPTHYAVAISYVETDMQAPNVVAKGKGYVAQRIKEIAKEHDVITMENKSLAQTLYRNVEIGEEVPEDLFKAVAEVLAYVYRLKGKV